MTVCLDGLTLQVSDLDASREFYDKIPGAVEEVFVPGRIAIFRIGKARIGLLSTGLHRGFHMEFETENLDQLFSLLKQSGIKITGEPKMRPHGERTFIVFDPDGYQLEFEEIESQEN